LETCGGPVAYERLVIAAAELAADALPGFGEAAHDVYTLDGALAAGRALRELRGGRVVVLVSRLPYKCPAAPYETALLAEAVLPKAGVCAHRFPSAQAMAAITREPFAAMVGRSYSPLRGGEHSGRRDDRPRRGAAQV